MIPLFDRKPPTDATMRADAWLSAWGFAGEPGAAALALASGMCPDSALAQRTDGSTPAPCRGCVEHARDIIQRMWFRHNRAAEAIQLGTEPWESGPDVPVVKVEVG